MRLTSEQLREMLQRPGMRKANPDAAGNSQGQSDPVGRLASPKRERGEGAPLVKKPRRNKTRQGRLAIICSIIAFRNRLVDDDNNIGGTKPLRDAISRMLGIDDGSSRIRFEYAQAHTTGPQGCVVKLTRL